MESNSVQPRRIALLLAGGLLALAVVRGYFELVMRHRSGLLRWFEMHPILPLLLIALSIVTSLAAAWLANRGSARRLVLPIATATGALTTAIHSSLTGTAVGFFIGLLFFSDRLRRFAKRTSHFALRWVAPALAIAIVVGFLGRMATYADSPAIRLSRFLVYALALVLIVMVVLGGERPLRWRRPGDAASGRASDVPLAVWRRLGTSSLKLVLIGVCLVAGIWLGWQMDVYRRIWILNRVGNVYQGVAGNLVGGAYGVFLGETASDRHLRLLRGLPQIREISIHSAAITDEGCRHLAIMRQLEELYMSNVNIHDAGLRHIAGLPKLKWLSVGQTHLTRDSFRVLPTLPSLTRIELSDIATEGPGLRDVSLPVGLVEVKLHNCGLTDDELAPLGKLKFVNRMYLRDNQIRGPGLVHLAQQTSLTSLDLSHNPLDDRHLSNLAGLTLIGLDMDGVHLSEAGMAAITRQRWLYRLSVRKSDITDQQLRRIAASTQLQIAQLDASQLSPRSMIGWRQRDVRLYVEYRTLEAADIARLADLGSHVQVIACELTPGAVAEFAHHPRLFDVTDCQIQERFIGEVGRYVDVW
jgi:hypothetical protein